MLLTHFAAWWELEMPDWLSSWTGIFSLPLLFLYFQIDLRFEARCLEEFVDNFEDIPNVRFPKPIRPYCKRDVLVETFEVGWHYLCMYLYPVIIFKLWIVHLYLWCELNLLSLNIWAFQEGDPISNFISNTEENNISLKEAIALSGVDALLQMVSVSYHSVQNHHLDSIFTVCTGVCGQFCAWWSASW